MRLVKWELMVVYKSECLLNIDVLEILNLMFDIPTPSILIKHVVLDKISVKHWEYKS
jgi:hypothetical protein